jgi:hypothetical protein
VDRDRLMRPASAAVVWALPNLFWDSECGWQEGSEGWQWLLRQVDVGRLAESWLSAVASSTGCGAGRWSEGSVVRARSPW